MLLACLAGCSQKTDEEATADIEDEASESAMTLCMYLLSENKVSPEQEQAIEDAVNKITKAKFKTQMDLKFYTADEYYTALEKAFSDRASAELRGEIAAPVDGAETMPDETEMTEIGIQIKYPTIASYQVDIFYVGGYEKFSQYVLEGRMKPLDSELESGTSKKLKEYIASAYLNYTDKIEGSIYGIPTNAAIGEYTYVLLNDAILEDMHYDTESGIALFDRGIVDTDLAKYISDIQSNPDYASYKPLYSELSNAELITLSQVDGTDLKTGSSIVQQLKYFGVNEYGQVSDRFSLIGDVYQAGATLGTTQSYMFELGANVTGKAAFRDSLSQIMSYKQSGYFGTEQDLEDGKVAVAFVKGDAKLPENYKELGYTAVAVKNPTVETMDLYDHMFAVSSYTTSETRSMEILTYLNTDEELHNIFRYGVEGLNYELVDSSYIDDETGLPYKVVRTIADTTDDEKDYTYNIDPMKVGNTLIGYCPEGEDPSYREYVQAQNRDVTSSVTMGFKYTEEINPETLAVLRTASAEVEELINNYQPTATDNWSDYESTGLRVAISAIINREEVKNMLAELTSMAEPSEEGGYVGINYVYIQWAKTTKIYVTIE